jgi:hypothetical protein
MKMKTFFRILALAGFGLTLIPSFLLHGGHVGLDGVRNLMLWGTVLWFAAGIFRWLTGGRVTTPAKKE